MTKKIVLGIFNIQNQLFKENLVCVYIYIYIYIYNTHTLSSPYVPPLRYKRHKRSSYDKA